MRNHDAENRYKILDRILDDVHNQIKEQIIIILHKKIECANKTYHDLNKKSCPASIYHLNIIRDEPMMCFIKLSDNYLK